MLDEQTYIFDAFGGNEKTMDLQYFLALSFIFQLCYFEWLT